MNTVWSDNVQSIDCLYLSRKLRFADRHKEAFTHFFDIPEHANILEIGCGPGALSEAIARWYPKAAVHGTDLDSNFIDFAKNHIPAASFSEEDATALSFSDESVDVTISNTVSEHIEPSRFFGEQYRVLKKGGVCLVLSSRKGIQQSAPCVARESEWENELWARVSETYSALEREFGVCAYPMTEQELPLAMEKYGFRNVSVEYVTLHMTPDDPSNDHETAYAIIESERASALGAAESLRYAAASLITEEEVERLKTLVNERYDARLALYDQGEKQWDTYVSLIMMVRGEK